MNRPSQYDKDSRWLIERQRAKDVWDDEFVCTSEEHANRYIKHMVERHNIDPGLFRIRKLAVRA